MLSHQLSYRRRSDIITVKRKQACLPKIMTGMDVLLQVQLRNLDYSRVIMTPELSDLLVVWYQEQYKLPAFRCGPRHMSIESTCYPGLYHITGSVPYALFDNIYKYAIVPELEVTLQNKTYLLRGTEMM